MNENEQHLDEVQDEITVHHDRRSKGKPIHHTLSFWIFVILMLAAILYYIVSLNFATAPR
ncbi:MAG TPA: hypothetical protein VGK10_18190 [Prolixibacteraceae bacterium]|jgi:hypothetical protein